MPSKFKPTRERKRKVIDRQSQPQTQPIDSNAAIINESKSEREERRQKLRDELRAQQPKVSAKKSKRLEKYIEKKLKKDEAADYVRKLEKEKGLYNATGLQSSKTLKRKFGDFVNGQVASSDLSETVIKTSGDTSTEHQKYPVSEDDDVESEDSFEEDHRDAFGLGKAPSGEMPKDDLWIQARAPPVQGTGLAKPLPLGANGMPLIPLRGAQRHMKAAKEHVGIDHSHSDDKPTAGSFTDEEAWQGFSDDVASPVSRDSDEEDEFSDEAQDADLDPRLKNIDSRVLDALLAELERSDDSSDNGGPLSDDDGPKASATRIAHSIDTGLESDSATHSDTEDRSDISTESESEEENGSRTSAFKSWATQQLNQSLGHIPFYEAVQDTADPTDKKPNYVKPAAGFRLGVKDAPRPADDRRAYTVPVQRSAMIQESRSNLPILQHEQEIMETIHNHAVVVVKGDTGSGKTTQLPQFLFEAGFGDKVGPTPGLIGVTQPRRVAAVSMAKRVAEELGDHRDKVAHQIRFDTTVSSNTAIKFMTDGILLRELSQDLLLKKYSAIIIDEAHERSVNTDILIGMLSKIVPARLRKTEQNPEPRPLKLVIMSATLNIQDFLHERLFPANIRPPVVEAEGRQHRVTTHFALKSRPDYIEEAIEKVKRGHRKLPKGGILVFLTGQNEIKYVLSRLRKDLTRSVNPVEERTVPRMHFSAADAPLEPEDLDFGTSRIGSGAMDQDEDIDIFADEDELDKEFQVSDEEDVEENATSNPEQANKLVRSKVPYDTAHILPLYSQLPTKEQLRIFEPPPDRARLIVLATNVAETSLTIPGIRYVFDCGRSKERKFNTDTGVQSFEIDYISKASAEQRTGRAGRTGPGHCWRLYSSAVYEQFFPDHTEPEILRTPAENVVLQLKGFRYPKPVTEFPFPNAPKRSMLERAESLLRNLGAVIGPHAALTDMGKQLTLYPLSPRLGRILVKATEQPKLLSHILTLVAVLSVDDVFINQTQLDDHDGASDQDMLKQQYGRVHATFGKHDKSSDALKMLTAMQLYLSSVNKEEFCKQNFVRSKAMQEASQLLSQLRGMVTNMKPELAQYIRDTKPSNSLKADGVKGINATLASGYVDQVALRYDLHPTPPVLLTRPTRAIDVPYLPLMPLENANSSSITDSAVFIHPSSLLSRLSVKAIPDYAVYRYLQTSQPQTVSTHTSPPKTRMLPLCALDANMLLNLIRDTGLIEYGKPVPKTNIEEVPSTRPKERICWLSTEVKSQDRKGGLGWPLPPSRVRQVLDMKAKSGWRVVEVLA